MLIERSLVVAADIYLVWAFLAEPERAAACFPGASLTEMSLDGRCKGKVAVRIGPFSAEFEGEARIERDDAARSGSVEGRAQDRRGGSRSQLKLAFSAHRLDGATRIDLAADITLAGPIAQFGKTGLIFQTADVLIAEFAKNLERALEAIGDAASLDGAPIAQSADELSAMSVMWSVVKNRWSGGVKSNEQSEKRREQP